MRYLTFVWFMRSIDRGWGYGNCYCC